MILMGFTCKPRRVSITALPPGPQPTGTHHERVPETTGKRFLSLKKDKIRLKECLLMWTMHVPTLPPIQGVPDPEDVEPGKQSPYSPDLNLCEKFLFRKLKHLLREDEFGGHEEATLAVQRAMRRVSEDEL
ncbi:Uncharacterized protein FKW44_006785 [Caligus rogercresseyi]|uniref:Uncharacterized protein n=1 Tax=Caligus rogercresseyi TaxID=217165 RepID=A0A7T8QT52_CALRO|nr:Uncharacterized protein FKW44_006785 [Caligus rogercresseyi]